MHKIVALDLGDQWVGIALSDALGIMARPVKTVIAAHLEKELTAFFVQETVTTVVVGYPKTMKGTESEQTKKVLATKEILEKNFPDKEFVLWDERLSSKRADTVSKNTSKEEKLKSHARAAAFILDSYLTFLNSKRNLF